MPKLSATNDMPEAQSPQKKILSDIAAKIVLDHAKDAIPSLVAEHTEGLRDQLFDAVKEALSSDEFIEEFAKKIPARVNYIGSAPLIDGQLRADLASGESNQGSSLVGFTPSGSGAVAESVQSALRRLVFSGQYSSGANFTTALAALTDTAGVAALTVKTDGAVTLTGSTANAAVLTAKVTGDSNARLTINGGSMLWGSGSATPDITISRSAAGMVTYNCDQDNITAWNITNANTGTSAYTRLYVGNSVGGVQVLVTSINNTSLAANAINANEGALTSDSTLAGLLIENTTSGGYIRFAKSGIEVARFDANNHFIPGPDDELDLGSASKGWRDVYSTRQFLGSDGGADLPTYSFLSDPNTGIKWGSSGEMQVVLNGVAQFDFFGNAFWCNELRLDFANGDFRITRSGTAAGLITGSVVISGTASNAIGADASSSTVLNLPAGTTGVSTIRLAHGSAPTSPVNGDMWTTTAGLFVRINGATVGPLS